MLEELYQEVIIDHGRRPRNQGELPNATHVKEGHNPLCGDHLVLHLCIDKACIVDVKFTGQGCAISMASASLMSEAIKGKSLSEAQAMFDCFHDTLTTDQTDNLESLGKLAVLVGVRQYPMRVKCATLAWHTLVAAMNNDDKDVSTE